MTVKELCEKCNFVPLTMPEPNRTVCGGYVGDLLSWVMGRAKKDCVWITIMTNINTVAVASLADVGAVVLSEGVLLEDSIITTAQNKGVNILSTTLPSFETAIEINKQYE